MGVTQEGGAYQEQGAPIGALDGEEAIAAMADPVLVFDPESHIAWTNPAVEARLGFDRLGLIGKTPDFIVIPADGPFRLSDHVRRVNAGGGSVRLAVSLRTRLDEAVPVVLTISPFDDGRGWRGAIAVAHVPAGSDERYAAEHEAAERLRALDEMKNAFLSALSHELRTPVTAILGLARTMEREYDRLTSEEIGEFTHRISTKAAKLDRLLNDLLDLDRLRLGMVEPVRRSGNIADLIRHVVEELDAPQRARIELDLEDFLISLDQPQTERIVENLILNALTHTPDGTRIWVSARSQDRGVLILVEDNGPGIPAEMRENVFEPFTQGPVAQYAPGVGIGLSLVRRFASIHGGRAWVEEREGGGASFRVFLPNGPAQA